MKHSFLGAALSDDECRPWQDFFNLISMCRIFLEMSRRHIHQQVSNIKHCSVFVGSVLETTQTVDADGKK